MKKILLVVLSIVALLVLLAALFLNSTKPTYNGNIDVAGIQTPVTIKYDEFGIPHIYARNAKDAYFALGFVQAQERLFQMEMIRRVATGTLAEIFGSELVSIDKLFRTLGIAEKSKQLAKKFNEQDKVYKQFALSYFEGINAFIDEGPTPVEFRIIGIPKRKFSITDAYNASGYMSFGFADGFRVDPLTSKIAATLGMQYLDDIGLHSIYDSTYIQSYFQPESVKLSALTDIIDKLPIPLIDGSNSWIIGPEKSANGHALFENDTHIGFSQPSVWFEAHLEYPGTSLYGYYLAGFPFAILGHNRIASWGMTMFENDDVDLFQEKENPDNKNQIWRIDQWQDLSQRSETIKIKNEDPIEITIRESDHGPVINDVILNDKTATHPVSVWWEFLHTSRDFLEPTYSLGQCASMDDARHAASLIEAPGLNIMYADVDGNIAWWASSRLPIRPAHINSKLILDGSTGKDDYMGYYDFTHNPRSENPPSHYVYSANNQPDSVKGILYPGYYRPMDRALQIVKKLEAKNDWTVEEVMKMTANVTSPIAPLVAEEFALILEHSDDNEIKELGKILANWDGDHQQDAIQPTVYYNMLSWTLYYAMADELGYEDFINLSNSEVMKRSYLKLVLNNNSVWWDDISTKSIETREDIIMRSAKKAIATIKRTTQSSSQEGWNWYKVHTVTHEHPLGKVKMLKSFFDVGPLTTSGGNEVIDNMMFKLDTTGFFPVIAGPAVRTVIDMSDIDGGMSINPTGQSGHFLSKHYDDQAQMFVDVKYRPQLMNEEEIEENKSSVLTLLPKK